jgi:hypothetical protein
VDGEIRSSNSGKAKSVGVEKPPSEEKLGVVSLFLKRS